MKTRHSVLVSFDFHLEALLVVALHCNLEPQTVSGQAAREEPQRSFFLPCFGVRVHRISRMLPHRVARYKDKEIHSVLISSLPT